MKLIYKIVINIAITQIQVKQSVYYVQQENLVIVLELKVVHNVDLEHLHQDKI